MVPTANPILRSLAAVLLSAVLGFACPRPVLAAPDAAAPVANGPLNAPPQEIVRRYGPVLRHNARVRHHQVLEGGTVLDGDLHGKNGLVIRVVYNKSRAVVLEFNRATGPLTTADVNALLTSCAGASSWEMGKDSTDASKFYHRADHRAVAHWSIADESLLVAAEGETADDKLMDHLIQ